MRSQTPTTESSPGALLIELVEHQQILEGLIRQPEFEHLLAITSKGFLSVSASHCYDLVKQSLANLHQRRQVDAVAIGE